MMSRCAVAVFLLSSIAGADDGPRSLDPRIKIELFAEQPQIRTPTGIDVDSGGRVWAIESNTHFRPENYDGHPSDRLLILQDADADGRADDVKVFADGFTHAMSVAVRPVWMDVVEVGDRDQGTGEGDAQPAADSAPSAPHQIFLATRREILLLEDTNGDDVCDRQTVLAHLETAGNYPHNGLAGFAFDALGWMYFGFGENLGEDYTLIGRESMVDGRETEANPSTIDHRPSTIRGGGEGGNIYRMRPDGTQLAHWATGFWNPHASCVDAFGRLFTVDNDPDSRPPCRLLHVIEGGDYGYKFRNGRKGQHPFTAWNGEIPGTLPMVAGTGEAPSGIVAYEHDGLPEEYLGNLLVTSWGDHRIDRFRLQPKGASFESIAEPLIVGGENFRPVGLALGPDGSLYCTDWVLRDYNLHGKGRVWRIAAVEDAPAPALAPDAVMIEAQVGRLRELVGAGPLPVRRAAARMLTAVQSNAAVGICRDESATERAKYECLMALAQLGQGDHHRVLKSYVPDRDGPYDSVQTGMSLYFDESPSLTALERIMDEGVVSDPLYLLAGLRNAVPVMRTLGNSRSPAAVEMINRLIDQRDPFVFSELVRLLRETVPPGQLANLLASDSGMTDDLCAAVMLAAQYASPDNADAAGMALQHPEPIVRRLAVQWAAEEHLTDLRPQVEAVLTSEPMTTELFLATIAALDMLNGHSPRDFEQAPLGKYVVPLLTNENTPDAVKIQALRLVDADDPQLTVEVWRQLLGGRSSVHLEAIRSLSESTQDSAVVLLLEELKRPLPPFIGPNELLEALQLERQVQACEALVGLASWARDADHGPEVRQALVTELVRSEGEFARKLRVDQELAGQIVRTLRGTAQVDEFVWNAVGEYQSSVHVFGEAVGPQQAEIYQQTRLALGPDVFGQHLEHELNPANAAPTSVDAWRAVLTLSGGVEPRRSDIDDVSLGGPVERGRLTFYHPNGPGCYKCHTVEGRGGRVGPDLSYIGRSFTREKLIASILEPSKEVSPQFTTWNMLTRDGVVHTGMIVHENEGRTILGDSEGRMTDISTYDIEERVPQRVSVMPEKLWERMTVQEFRDLLAYLQSLGVPQRSADDADQAD